VPDKLAAGAIFALLDRAPFGRLATYAPPQGNAPGHCYVVPLQFLHREGLLYLITTPGRKLTNLRAAPWAVCFQIDFAEAAGWTSVCAWGDYSEVTDLRERLSVIAASFSKYPDYTARRSVSILRRIIPSADHILPGRSPRAPVFGQIELHTVSGRFWPGLMLSAAPTLVHPPRADAQPNRPRGKPVRLEIAACLAVLDSRPLARLGCYHPSRRRTYCLPLWHLVEGNDLWFYYPPGGRQLLEALEEHPQGVCVQADDLDAGPDADPGRPWRSVLAVGTAGIVPLGSQDHPELSAARQAAILHAIRERLYAFDVRSVFVPPDPDLGAPPGYLIRVRLQTISGQATGEQL